MNHSRLILLVFDCDWSILTIVITYGYVYATVERPLRYVIVKIMKILKKSKFEKGVKVRNTMKLC